MPRTLLKTGLTATLACVLALTAGGQASASAPFTKAQAKQQLLDITQPDGVVRRDPTTELRDLALALPKLDGADARKARAILSRPPDGNGNQDPYGGSWPRPGHFTEETVETPRFVVHYPVYDDCNVGSEGCDEPSLTDTSPMNGTPDFVDATVDAVEESIDVENDDLGWPEPKGDGDGGEPTGSSDADRFDVYIGDLCGGPSDVSCVFGYANPQDNSDECNDAPFKCAAYLVLDNDYSEFGQSGGLLGLRVTTAHEYNHVLQFNLDSNEDVWMFESTATWAEDKVFPMDDDWVRSYMGTWARTSTGPLTSGSPGGGLRIYGTAIWNHWIEHGYGSYGPDVVLKAWQMSRDTTPRDYAVGAYDAAIKDEGGDGFASEFFDFTAASAEWNTGLGNLPNHEDVVDSGNELPDVKRVGKMKFGKKSTKQVLDNTSYALFNVDPKNADTLRLKASGPKNVDWAIALVGRTGERFTGAATVTQGLVDPGARKTTAVLPDAQLYDRITAVVTNADGRVDGPKAIFGNFHYSKNGQNFKLKVR